MRRELTHQKDVSVHPLTCLRSVKFCANVFGNILPDDVSKDMGAKWQSNHKLAAQKYFEGLQTFGSDPLHGFVVELETGKLGLVKI